MRRLSRGEVLVPAGTRLYSEAVDAAMWAEVPDPIQRTWFRSSDEDLRGVSYAGNAANIDLSPLPVPMQREIAWSLHKITATGMRISLGHLRSTLRALDLDGVTSLVDHDIDMWIELFRRGFYRRHHRIPTANNTEMTRVILDEARKLEAIIASLSNLPHDDHRPMQSPGVVARDQ